MPLEYDQVCLGGVVESLVAPLRPRPVLPADEAVLRQLVGRVFGKAQRYIEAAQFIRIRLWEKGMRKPADRNGPPACIFQAGRRAHRTVVQTDGALQLQGEVLEGLLGAHPNLRQVLLHLPAAERGDLVRLQIAQAGADDQGCGIGSGRLA